MAVSFLFELPRWSFRWQLPTIVAALFIATTVLEPKACFQRIPQALLWFLGYLYVFAVSALWHGWSDTTEMAQFFLFLVQAILVFWAGFNLMCDEHIAGRVLWSFVIGCLVRGALPLFGVGRTALEERWTGGERVTAFGQDPNFSATLLAAGLIALIGLTHGPSRSALRPRLLAWPLAALLGIAVLDTGSRGGLVALAVALLAFVFSYTPTLKSRFKHVLGVVLAVGALVAGVMQTEVMRNRFEATVAEGTMAGREKMFPALWDMFLEKPLAGWGPTNNEYELAKRAPFMDRTSRSAHNLFLELLTATGLVGALPFLVALGLCLRAAWRGRRGPYGILPVALLALFVIAGMSLDLLAHKPLWFVLAFALASESRASGAASGAPCRS